jgi:hypothetical protein
MDNSFVMERKKNFESIIFDVIHPHIFFYISNKFPLHYFKTSMYQFIVMFKSSIFSKFPTFAHSCPSLPTFPISNFSQLFPPKKTFKEVGFPSQNSFFRLIKPFPPFSTLFSDGNVWE